MSILIALLNIVFGILLIKIFYFLDFSLVLTNMSIIVLGFLSVIIFYTLYFLLVLVVLSAVIFGIRFFYLY